MTVQKWEAAQAMRQLRDSVLLRWKQRMEDQLPCAAGLADAQLFDTLPELYEHLMASVGEADDERAGLCRTSVARAHGAERARMRGFGPADLLLEFQLLRRCVWEIAHEHGLELSCHFLRTMGSAFDTAERDAMTEYNLARCREHTLALQELAESLRSHLHVAATAAQLIVRATDYDRIGALAGRIRTRLALVEERLDGAPLRDPAAQECLPLLLSTFELTALLHEACTDALPGRCSVAGEPITGTWCRLSLRQALRNLLALAPDDASPVHVAVRRMPGRVALSVQHVHELPSETVRHLFSSRNKAHHPMLRGWGIGLGFVRDVAESHGGSAIVYSAPGKGTAYTIDIPIDACPFVPDSARR